MIYAKVHRYNSEAKTNKHIHGRVHKIYRRKCQRPHKTEKLKGKQKTKATNQLKTKPKKGSQITEVRYKIKSGQGEQVNSSAYTKQNLPF